VPYGVVTLVRVPTSQTIAPANPESDAYAANTPVAKRPHNGSFILQHNTKAFASRTKRNEAQWNGRAVTTGIDTRNPNIEHACAEINTLSLYGMHVLYFPELLLLVLFFVGVDISYYSAVFRFWIFLFMFWLFLV
jgi:hypothetical protein